MVNNGLLRMLCLVLSLACPAELRAELIDHIVAAVNGDVITWSELRQVVAFNTVLGGTADRGRVEKETLEGLINRRLLLQEAYRLRFIEVSEGDVAAEVAKLRERLGGDIAVQAFLTQTGITQAQLGLMLGERILVERFIEKKIGMFARISREDAEDYYNDHTEEFAGERFPEVQKKIIAVLSEQVIAQQLDQYVAELREKADIRRNPIGG